MDESESEMRTYYKVRAPVYDEVYSYPERQEDLRFLEIYIPEQLAGRDVLEIAAGTGYWSQFIVSKAKTLLATDVTGEALVHINERDLPAPIHILQLDAYSLEGLAGLYSGVFAGLWLSHVPRQRLREFLESLHRFVEPGSPVIFIDNSRAQCIRLPLSYTDEFANTYQDRQLADGSIHRVLKNFPTESELVEAIQGLGENHKYQELENFWLFQYEAI